MWRVPICCVHLSLSVSVEQIILKDNTRLADRKRRKEKQERLKVREASREKKLLQNLDHVKPDFSTAEYEKRLLKIATKGGTARGYSHLCDVCQRVSEDGICVVHSLVFTQG